MEQNIRKHSDLFGAIIRKLIERIRRSEKIDISEVEVSYRIVENEVRNKFKRDRVRILHRTYRCIASIAAVIGLVLLVGWWWKSTDASYQNKNLLSINSMEQIVVPKGKSINYTFSDGTKICINAGSKVTYPRIFAKDKREISVEGEVYLDVTKDVKRPFIIDVNKFKVKVFGTAFDISAYPEDKVASVVLVRGKVEVITKANNRAMLRPNQKIDIEGERFSIHPVESVDEYISWKDNILLLNEKTMGEIFDKLERYYGCNIKYDCSIDTISITGKLGLKPNVEDVIKTLCVSTRLHYNIDKKKNIFIYI